MLRMIREYDYAHYTRNVEKLIALTDGREKTDEEKLIFDFLSSAQEQVDVKLDTLNSTTEYIVWCLSEEAQEITLFARSLRDGRKFVKDEFNSLIVKCVDDLLYLLSVKCAQFYTED